METDYLFLWIINNFFTNTKVPLGTQVQEAVPLGTQVQEAVPLGTQVQEAIPLGTQVQEAVPLGTQVQEAIPLQFSKHKQLGASPATKWPLSG